MHIVIFTGGEAPLPETTFSYFKHVAAPDVVIAADSGVDTLVKFRSAYKNTIDFTPDYILGDMDSITDKQLLSDFPEATVEKFPCDKDYTDTELALEKACSFKKCKQDIVTLIGGAGGRVDHLLAIYETFSTVNHADVWLYGNQLLYFVTENQEVSISTLKQNDYVSISRPNGVRSEGKITSSGLEWESDCFRKEGMPSMSNRIAKKQFERGEPVKLRIESGSFLVIVPSSAKVQITDLPQRT